MRTVLIIAGIITAIPVIAIIVLAVAGSFMARGHRAERTVTYRASPDEVWRIVTDWAGRPSWRPSVKAVERMPDREGHAVWREKRRIGGAQISGVLEQDDSARRMVTVVLDESAYSGTWTWHVTPAADGGAGLSIVEEGAIHNPMFRAVAAWFLDMHSTMDGFHRDLARRLGEQ